MIKLSDKAEFILIVGVSFSYFVMTSAVTLLAGTRHIDLTTDRVLIGILIESLIFCVVAFVLWARGWSVRRLGLRFSWQAAAAGIPLFIIYLLVYWVTATLVLLVVPSARASMFTMTARAPFWLMVLFFVVNSLFEELTVTGYVISSLATEGAGIAITASTLLRFSYYLYQGPFAAVSILPLGLLFGALYWRRRNLWPLIVAHTIVNVLVFALTS